MIAYGKNNKFRTNLPDNHPKKGYLNWWEVEWGGVDKKSARQQAKINIRKEMETNFSDDVIENEILVEEIKFHNDDLFF